MLFMGIQSSMAYIVFGWLPTLLIERGYSDARWLDDGHSHYVPTGLSTSAPWIARLHRPAPGPTAGIGMCSLGLVLLAAPLAWRWPGAVLLGLGQGGSFSLALSLLVLRTANERLAGQLSGLVQGGGYTLAALGPFGVGLMLQAGATTQHIAWLLIGLIGVCCGFAFFAGRKRQLDDQSGQLQVYHR